MSHLRQFLIGLRARLGRPMLPVPLIFALMVGSGVGAVSGLSLLFEAQRADQTAWQQAELVASQMAILAADRISTGRTDLLSRDLSAAEALLPDLAEIVVLDPTGRVTARIASPTELAGPGGFLTATGRAGGASVRVTIRRPGLDKMTRFATLLVGLDLLVLVIATVVAMRLAHRTRRPLRRFREVVESLTRERFTQEKPARLAEKDAQAAMDRLWDVGRSLTSTERELAAGKQELAAQNLVWQRRYGQARGLIDLMAEFNQAMGLQAVLERLSGGLSRFFAGDGVAIWIREPQRGDLTLAAEVAATFPRQLSGDEDWVRAGLAGSTQPIRAPWLQDGLPSMVTPLLDARGLAIGIVGLVSTRRSHYIAEEQQFLQTVIGHAALAIQNATVYEYTDALSRIDGLTGLQNRRQFDFLLSKELERARRAQQPLSLLMVDIDHFKQVNDERGHQAGDRALQQLGELIHLTRIRTSDAGFRFGGEEFAILLTEADKTTGLAMAERLRQATEATKFSDDMRMTISVGVASYPMDASDLADLVASADRALYEAKNGGRNQVRAA